MNSGRFLTSNSKVKGILLSVISLLLSLVLIVFVSYSWFCYRDTGQLSTSALTIDADSGLSLNFGDDYSGKLDINNHINVNDFKLSEASSVDGRNIYFPTTGTGTNTGTNDMIFREGTANDVNTRYLSLDFSLRAAAGEADVFLDAGKTYAVLTSGVTANSIRMAFNFNDGTAPIVVSPGLLPQYERTSNVISYISAQGRANCVTQTSQSIYNYIRGNGVLCHLDVGEVKNVTLTVWLEGTDEEFSDMYANNNFNINVKFTSTWDNVIEYRFVDDTAQTDQNSPPVNWLTADNAKILIYDKTNKLYYPMTQSASYSADHTWIAYVPEAVSDFQFNRYDPLDQTICWNYWTPDMTNIESRKTSDLANRTYYATHGSTNTNDTKGPCVGYWKNDGYPEVTVYFTNNKAWSGNIYIYYYDSIYKTNNKLVGWHGDNMSYAGTNTYGESYYGFTIPKDSKFIISCNDKQTVDINLSDYYGTIGSNNKLEIYLSDAMDGSGHYYVTPWVEQPQ